MRSFQASTERRKEDPTNSVGEELDLSAHRLQGLFIYLFIGFFLFVYVVNLCLFPFVPEIILGALCVKPCLDVVYLFIKLRFIFNTHKGVCLRYWTQS